MEGVFARLLIAKKNLAPELDRRMRIGLSSIHRRAVEAAMKQFVGSLSVDEVVKLSDEIQ